MAELRQQKPGILKERYGLVNFVETGTKAGYGLEAAARLGFARCLSCEIDPALAAAAAARFPDADVRCSDSLSFLEAALPSLEGPTLFWLDAHRRFRDIGPDDDMRTAWPVLHEVDLIRRFRNSAVAGDVLLCDDLRGKPKFAWGVATRLSRTHFAQAGETACVAYLPRGAT